MPTKAERAGAPIDRAARGRPAAAAASSVPATPSDLRTYTGVELARPRAQVAARSAGRPGERGEIVGEGRGVFGVADEWLGDSRNNDCAVDCFSPECRNALFV